jgi:hypothetical protein
VASLVARKAYEATVAPAVGSNGSLDSGGQVCVAAFGRNLASVAVKMFSRLI